MLENRNKRQENNFNACEIRTLSYSDSSISRRINPAGKQAQALSKVKYYQSAKFYPVSCDEKQRKFTVSFVFSSQYVDVIKYRKNTQAIQLSRRGLLKLSATPQRATNHKILKV